MIRVTLVLALLVLAGCGAEGEPVRPSISTTVSVGSDGVSTSTGVTLKKGPVTVGVGF